MSHLVKPTAHRAGKTYLWQHNSVINTAENSYTIGSALNKISGSMLRRKRLYVVKTSINSYNNKIVLYRLLFAPKIKTKPREHRIGSFVSRVVYRPHDWADINCLDNAKLYVYRRQEKMAKLPRKQKVQINKWLSKRMFRAAKRPTWFRRPINTFVSRITRVACFINNKKLVSGAAYYVSKFKKLHRKYRYQIKRRSKWKFEHNKTREFNSKKLSARLSETLGQSVKTKALNIFSYLAAKNLLDYKTHQRHFWNYNYRRFRFQYKNYFDVVNGFFVLSLLDGAENLLLTVLKTVLPIIIKIRRFFKFLKYIIMAMPELRKKYAVFKIAIAGKLAGGTKRTKAHSIGYGVFPVQTLTINAVNNFISYTHIYGEFGVKLLTCKDSTIKGVTRWK